MTRADVDLDEVGGSSAPRPCRRSDPGGGGAPAGDGAGGGRPPDALAKHVNAGLLYYAMTLLIVVAGMTAGRDLLRRHTPIGLLYDFHGESYANWDGQWYKKIAAAGYEYHPLGQSSVVFFPVYPLLGRGVSVLTGLGPGPSLLLVSNALLLATLVLVSRYAEVVFGGDGTGQYALLAFCLLPTSFFLRMAYSESTFLFFATLALFGMRRGWDPFAIAFIVGLVTATRPVGVGLIPPLIIHAWGRLPGKGAARIARLALLVGVASWGILAYMAFLQVQFGEPFSFARSQDHWRIRPPIPTTEKLLALARLDPIAALFDPSVSSYWRTYDRVSTPLISYHLFGVVLFAGAIAATIAGVRRRWLTAPEAVASALLILIPYYTIAYESSFRSMGRYLTVVVPVYLVLGRMLRSAPAPVVNLLAAISSFYLGLFTAIFSSWGSAF
jgi:hypothetical protein